MSLFTPVVADANNQQAAMHKTNTVVLSTIAAVCYLNAMREGLVVVAAIRNTDLSHRVQLGVSSGILSAGSLGLGIAATVNAVKEFKKYKQELKK